jgi:hypothetical protein
MDWMEGCLLTCYRLTQQQSRRPAPAAATPQLASCSNIPQPTQPPDACTLPPSKGRQGSTTIPRMPPRCLAGEKKPTSGLPGWPPWPSCWRSSPAHGSRAAARGRASSPATTRAGWRPWRESCARAGLSAKGVGGGVVYSCHAPVCAGSQEDCRRQPCSDNHAPLFTPHFPSCTLAGPLTYSHAHLSTSFQLPLTANYEAGPQPCSPGQLQGLLRGVCGHQGCQRLALLQRLVVLVRVLEQPPHAVLGRQGLQGERVRGEAMGFVLGSAVFLQCLSQGRRARCAASLLPQQSAATSPGRAGSTG